eukprot:scaffold24624_cov194-Skeletonema_dohrnii-CCMP3373.AAC.1
MAAMALATTIIGEGTRRAAGKLDRPDLPRDLSVASSFLALVVGIVWCGLALSSVGGEIEKRGGSGEEEMMKQISR